MFTGLVKGVGKVIRIVPKGYDSILYLTPPWPLKEIILGESIAINGVCLTVISGQGLALNVSTETFSCTTLKTLKSGTLVNMERAIKLGERLGGHLVTGHVDCVGVLTKIEHLGASVRFYIKIPVEYLYLIVEKGSITIDGVSLTVNQIDAAGFFLNIIPHTLVQTTLRFIKENDFVNIETDLIGKYVARLLNYSKKDFSKRSRLSLEDLMRIGV